MRRILAATLLFVAFAMLPLFAQSPWTAIADRLRASIVFLEHCTGFSIDPTRKLILTAAHCEPEDKKSYLVDGTTASRVFVDYRKDLMVLRAHQIDKPGLKLAPHNPKWGEEVATLGFGWAQENPMFRVSHISHPMFDVDMDGFSGPFVAVDTPYVGGQSGGPVVNKAGEVVSIVQWGDRTGTFGAGVGVETIKDRVGRYFEQ